MNKALEKAMKAASQLSEQEQNEIAEIINQYVDDPFSHVDFAAHKPLVAEAEKELDAGKGIPFEDVKSRLKKELGLT